MTAATAARELNELAILRKYAQGAELGAIARDLNVDPDQVSEVVSAVGFQRGRAAELLRQREAALAQRRAKAVDAPPKSSPARETTRTAPTALVSVAASSEPDEGEEVAAGPSSQEPAAASGVEELLQRAAAIQRLFPKVTRVRALLTEIEGELAEAEKVAEAERRVDELRAALHEAQQALRALGGPAKAGRVEGPDPKAVRAWAAEQGIECAPHGRPNKTVVEAYLAATTQQTRGTR